MTQTKLRTYTIKSNKNITFQIGTVVDVQKYHQKLDFDGVFGKHKKKGADINSLIHVLVSYKLTENQSISKGSKWINRKEVLDEFALDEFEERTLFRVLEIVGRNKEEIMLGIQDNLFARYEFEHTNTNMDWTSFILYGDK